MTKTLINIDSEIPTINAVEATGVSYISVNKQGTKAKYTTYI